MVELERVSSIQRALLEEVRTAAEERQRAILEGAIGREARAALRTRARTATAAATPKANLADADRQRSARVGRLQAGPGNATAGGDEGGDGGAGGVGGGTSMGGGSSLLSSRGAAGGDVISIPATALREISDPATELLGTLRQILRVSELPPTTAGERDDKGRR
jgi:hypothetical protein